MISDNVFLEDDMYYTLYSKERNYPAWARRFIIYITYIRIHYTVEGSWFSLTGIYDFQGLRWWLFTLWLSQQFSQHIFLLVRLSLIDG